MLAGAKKLYVGEARFGRELLVKEGGYQVGVSHFGPGSCNGVALFLSQAGYCLQSLTICMFPSPVVPSAPPPGGEPWTPPTHPTAKD